MDTYKISLSLENRSTLSQFQFMFKSWVYCIVRFCLYLVALFTITVFWDLFVIRPADQFEYQSPTSSRNVACVLQRPWDHRCKKRFYIYAWDVSFPRDRATSAPLRTPPHQPTGGGGAYWRGVGGRQTVGKGLDAANYSYEFGLVGMEAVLGDDKSINHLWRRLRRDAYPRTFHQSRRHLLSPPKIDRRLSYIPPTDDTYATDFSRRWSCNGPSPSGNMNTRWLWSPSGPQLRRADLGKFDPPSVRSSSYSVRRLVKTKIGLRAVGQRLWLSSQRWHTHFPLYSTALALSLLLNVN